MNAELILGFFFVFILFVFVAGIFLFPSIFGISKAEKQEPVEPKSEEKP